MQRLQLSACLALLCLAYSSLHAQSSAAGTIIGRVFNPNTGEYVRSAQVRIEETGQTVISEGGGEYRLSPVPAGKATVVVTFTGYQKATATVSVAAGATVTQDFNLVSSLESAAIAGDAVK